MKQPIKMTPGDELHLTALMAPFSLNLVTGQDRQHLLGYGRAAFIAGHAQLRACTPEAAEDLIEEIIERISDHAVKAMAHQEARKQGNPEQIESARQATFQAEDCIKRDLRTLASRPEPTSVATEQAAWHAGMDAGLAQAAQNSAADVPASGAAALSEYLKTCEQHAIVPDVGGAFASAFAAGFNLAASQAALPKSDYLEGVNIPNLREALIFLGRENGVGEGEVGDKLSQYVNSVVSGVLSKKATLRAADRAAPDETQIKALMRKHRIWIEHFTLLEDDEPPRELRAVQAEQHQFEAFVQDLIALAATQAAQQADET
ncbi:hypothetical protein [Comamonas thiooxydans]|uniref:hypothetical protein n=1 Tax=Comamonas thiooxydans TaxID=363952 RepID=UPI002115AA35|nr:hypothetical protein [Comamonas thiooxydans]UUE94439.1 hypothetical protein MJ608_01815 [Comamonas thiooxydans]